MPATGQKLTVLNSFTLFCFSIFTAATAADPVTARLDSIERRVARLGTMVQSPADPATRPATQPAPEATPVRADSLAALRAAVDGGAQWIQTTGIDVSGDLDARGALIELLPGGPSWKPAITLTGNSSLSNATIKVPTSSYNASGARTGFSKALAVFGEQGTLRNVTFAPNSGFCIHVQKGRLAMESVKATTFSEYFVYQEPGTYVSAKWCEVKGGSRVESVWRVTGGNYLIEESTLDNSAGGKAVLRGDSPGDNDTVGGIVRRTKLVGQVGPNPLTEDDGGQMVGIDRWRFAEGWLYQLDAVRKPETIDFAQRLYLSGATAAEIVRATADRFIDGKQLAKVAKGKTKLSDEDIRLTLEFRNKEVGRHSRVLIEDCLIVGNLRLNARLTATIRRTLIQSTGDTTPISGNSQSTYPFPADRLIVGGEQARAPEVTLDGVAIEGGPALGIDPQAWPTVKLINGTTYRGKALSSGTLPRVFNGTSIDIAGTTRVRTDGGLSYRDLMGVTQFAWVGGYDGPRGTAARPASWKERWREYDEKRLRAFARSIKGPIFVLDIEHWEVDPVVHGQETATHWLERMATMCRIIKTERPDLIVGCYDILPASEYWALVNWAAWQRWKATGEKNNDLPDEWWAAKEAEYRAAFESWQKKNDFTKQIMLPAVDALFPNIYPNYRMKPTTGKAHQIEGTLQMDADVSRLKVEESLRVSDGKPVYPFYWPVVTEDGGEVVSAERTQNAIRHAMEAGAAGIVLWSDERPRKVLEETMRAIHQGVQDAAKAQMDSNQEK